MQKTFCLLPPRREAARCPCARRRSLPSRCSPPPFGCQEKKVHAVALVLILTIPLSRCLSLSSPQHRTLPRELAAVSPPIETSPSSVELPRSSAGSPSSFPHTHASWGGRNRRNRRVLPRGCRRRFWVAAGDFGDPTVRRHHLKVALDEARRLPPSAHAISPPIGRSNHGPCASPLMTPR